MKRKVKINCPAVPNTISHTGISSFFKKFSTKWLLSCNVPIAANKGVTANSILNRTGIRRHTPFRRKLPK